MRTHFLTFLLLLLVFPFHTQAQTPELPGLGEKKGTLFFYWGYNRSWFSESNLHFTGPDYDFTLYDLKATDRPTPFGKKYFKLSTFTIPQYNYRLGYHINDRLVISGGIDHMKYVIEPIQPTTISGVIKNGISGNYGGAYLNEAIDLHPDLLQFEHTDGLNLVSLDFEYLQPLFAAWKNRLSFYWNTGFGGFWMVAKTRAIVLGDGLDNDFHVAGYSMAAKTGPRIEFKSRVFLQTELKGGYASLPSVLIKNEDRPIADQNLSYLEWNVVLGVNLRLKRALQNRN